MNEGAVGISHRSKKFLLVMRGHLNSFFSLLIKKGAMKYKDYQVTDFIKDEFFVEWVMNPNAEVRDFWTEWIASNPGQVPVINKAKQFINSFEYAPYEPLSREEYAEIFENILKNEKSSSSESYRKNRWFILKIAATISFIALGLLFYLDFSAEETKDLRPQIGITQTVKSNPKGRKSLTKLPDGTMVKLNAESTISFDSRFGKNNRMVDLSGEAFFDVTPNRQLPFIIKMGDITTKVIGTSFNVRAFENESNTQIVVVSGEVAVTDKLGNAIVLNAHEMLEYDRYERSLTKSLCNDVKEVIGWKDGILLFNKDPFDKVVNKIERWYDVKIELTDNFKMPGDYTGEYHNKSLKKVMDGISYASGFKYSMIDNRIILSQ